jgi:tetratricopeptide (TPR) repeat protein
MMLSGIHLRLQRSIVALCCCSGVISPVAARNTGPQWVRASGGHFAMLTDADEKKSSETLLRFEQMRAVFVQQLMRTRLNLSQPLDIIGFKDHAEYAQVAPLREGQPISASGFFLPGPDRNYIVLDLSDSESWSAVSRQLASYFLTYNYPPTQPWFDEGFTQYFSSLLLDDRQARIGGDPAALVAQLSSQLWLPIPELFAMRFSDGQKGAPVFEAESWMVMHYLLSQNKLSETGTYLGLVEIQRIPTEQAIQQAYGVSAAQFEQAVKDYFRSVAPALQATAQPAGPASSHGPIQEFPTPVAPLDIGTSSRRIPDAEAKALVAELSLRMPEHREHAVAQLQRLAEAPLTETAVAHRALAWALLQNHEYDQAWQELGKAADLDSHDFWVQYYLALVPYEEARATSGALQHLPNVMQNLHAVLDQNPDFAEADNMLAMAQLEGGGVHAALTTIRYALGLSPRNQNYLLNLAKIYLAGKNWDDATALLSRLKDSQNKQIASAAQKHLQDLPTLRKYGVLPQRSAESKAAPEPAPKAQSEGTTAEDGNSSGEDQSPQPAQAGPDLRKSLYLRGKLLAVDCSQPPVAILKVAAKTKTMRLRTDDYKSLLLIGGDQFSCEWKNVAVVVNYKAGGKADGDLVSLEIQ